MLHYKIKITTILYNDKLPVGPDRCGSRFCVHVRHGAAHTSGKFKTFSGD